VVTALNLDAVAIGPEIDPGVPALATTDGPPLALALKSGNFGAPTSSPKPCACWPRALDRGRHAELFTANIAFLFPELPFLDRIAAARAAGFEKVECHYPYEFPIEVSAGAPRPRRRATHGPQHAAGRSSRVSAGGAAVPGSEAQFRRDFDRPWPTRPRSAPRSSM
jgi:hypothetical protein